MPKAKNPVKSTKKTFRIIEKLKELDGATISELDDHLDMLKSSIHNYLSTLEEVEYVVKEEDKTYHVGLRFLEAGSFARHRRQIYEAARPEVTELAEETGELANLLVEEHGRGVYIYRASGERAVKVDSFTGQRVYLHNTALGKAILSRLPREQVEAIIDRHGLPAETDRTITDREELFDELREIRERGVAFDREERLKGLRCVAAPVVSRTGNIEGAISVAGPTSRISGERFEEELPERIQNVANIVELNITYS
jgi:DNA-binding IclR family transcriptional regulator